jgi:multiple sugar transport system ATP-binding protein
MAAIRVDSLRKGFRGGRVMAVDDVSFTVPDGEFTCLLGPSGSGKTTVLRMLAGLERPDGGRIHIGDTDVTELEPKGRDLAMVFQGFALYRHMDVRRNIGYPLKVRKLPSSEQRSRVEEVAERLGIAELLDRMPEELSGGQQQRVAIARTLVRQPRAALYDEPMTGLDARLRAEMRLELRRIQQEFGVTTLMVTHDHIEAMTMSDWVGVMNAGKLQQFASPVGVFFDPANLFVATFVGEPRLNVFECDHREMPDGSELSCVDFTLDVGRRLEGARGKVSVGIRPQHIRLTLAEPGREQGTGPVVPGEVIVSEVEGTESVHMVSLRGSQVKLKTSADASLGRGQRVWLELPLSRLYFFDSESGERVGRDDRARQGPGSREFEREVS